MDGWRDKILESLKKYSGHEVSDDGLGLSVLCENAESVELSIWETDDCFQVNIGGWHEHFDELADALNCFAFGLSKSCRLKVTFRGNMECAWTLQSREAAGWVDESTTGPIFVPFWRSKSFEFRWNVLPQKT